MKYLLLDHQTGGTCQRLMVAHVGHITYEVFRCSPQMWLGKTLHIM